MTRFGLPRSARIGIGSVLALLLASALAGGGASACGGDDSSGPEGNPCADASFDLAATSGSPPSTAARIR
jgi:hypothetical protein